jgi:DNA-binding NarL/FixJ family response regulator
MPEIPILGGLDRAMTLAGENMRSTFLIVEDNLTFRQSLREMLEFQFPSVGIEEASNGDEAFLLLQKDKPDLIFMDIKLPGRNGLELTKSIKASNAAIDIIILTSYDIPEYRDAAIRSGASHFFIKGNTNRDEIVDVIKSTLAQKGKHCCSP